MRKLANLGRNLFLLLLPVLFTLVGLLRAQGVQWADCVAKGVFGVIIGYMLLLTPNTIAFIFVACLPLSYAALCLYSISLWRYDWLIAVGAVLLVRALWPVAFNERINELRAELQKKSARENGFIIKRLDWLFQSEKKDL